MAHAQAQLGITFNADLASREHHDVDDFIDVKLPPANKVTWDDVDTLAKPQEQGNEAWDACNTLVDAPYDEDAIAVLDRVHDRGTSSSASSPRRSRSTTPTCASPRSAGQVQARLKEKHQENTAELKERPRPPRGDARRSRAS